MMSVDKTSTSKTKQVGNAGCIDLMLEFDSASELDRYIADIVAKKQEYSIVERKELPGDRIMIRIHRQYNKSPFPTTEGGEK